MKFTQGAEILRRMRRMIEEDWKQYGMLLNWKYSEPDVTFLESLYRFRQEFCFF